VESWSVHQLYERAKSSLGKDAALKLQGYAQQLIDRDLPVIFTLRHLSVIVGSDFSFLRETVRRHRESANYRMYRIRKRSGQYRYIHAVSNQLNQVQQFLNTELLQHVLPHEASFAFHTTGGIQKCAARHCGAKWLIKFDLKDFFHGITEADVYQVFTSLGYRPLLSFELARICTTTRLPKGAHKHVRKGSAAGSAAYPDTRAIGVMGVLPQGAPTSPMLSNLVALPLDKELQKLAMAYGFVYTRYADDLTFSAYELPSGISIGYFRSLVISKITATGFINNKEKFQVLGPGSCKTVLGLLVDGSKPRISRHFLWRLDRLLYAIEKFGLSSTASHFAFDSEFGLYNHIGGLIAYCRDVDPDRGAAFLLRFATVQTPWA
jgi:RNA-directed DNA polymerase